MVQASGGLVHGAAKLGDVLGGHPEGVTDGAHDFECDALGFAGFEQIDGAQRDAGLAGERALTEQLAPAEHRQRCGDWRLHVCRTG